MKVTLAVIKLTLKTPKIFKIFFKSLYDTVYDKEYEPKWWKCAFDHVQIFYGSKHSGHKTERLCSLKNSEIDQCKYFVFTVLVR